MSSYKVIDDLVETCKTGQKSPENSPEKEGVSLQAVNQRHDRALKKLKKVL